MSGYLAGRVWLSALSSNLKPLAACLANFANDEGDGVFPSNGYLQWLLGWGESTVRQAMSSLKRDGFLVPVENVSGGRGKIPVYRIEVESLPSRPSWKEFKRGQNLAPLPERGQNSTEKGPENDSRNKEELKDEFNLKLTSSPSEKSPTRFELFQAAIFDFYNWMYGRDPDWDGSEGKQLSSLLKSSPKLDVGTFKQWLYNYSQSKDISPGERPRIFLPKLSRYSVTALNQYGRSVDVEDEAGGSVRQHNDDAFARVNGQVPRSSRTAFIPQTRKRGNSGLEGVAEILQLPGD